METLNEVIDWLLEEDNPPVRYLALTNLLNKSPRTSQVRRAKSRLMEYGATQGILEHAEEFWNDDDRAYWKYTGKYWQLIFLSQFLADGKDPHIPKGAKDIIEKRKWVSKAGGHCLTANILASVMRLRYGDHPVVVQETETLASRILADGGIKCTAMDYSLLPRCHMAQPKLLLCFAQNPPGEALSGGDIGHQNPCQESAGKRGIHLCSGQSEGVAGDYGETTKACRPSKRADGEGLDFRTAEQVLGLKGIGEAAAETGLAQVRLSPAL